MEPENLKKGLASSKVEDRKKAAKVIGKERITELGDELWAAYQKQTTVKNSWQAQIVMINSLGLIKYRPAKDPFYRICKVNEAHDMITFCAAMAYTRIAAGDNNDISPVLELCRFGNFSVVDGAMRRLGADKVKPSPAEIVELIRFIEGFPAHGIDGYGDIREGGACACAGWDKNLVGDFLERCLAGRQGCCPDKYRQQSPERNLRRRKSRIAYLC